MRGNFAKSLSCIPPIFVVITLLVVVSVKRASVFVLERSFKAVTASGFGACVG